MKPVIFVALSNDHQDPNRYLRNLSQEGRALQTILDHYNGPCEFVMRSGATLDDVFNVFADARYRGGIAVFHFAGHAGSYQLFLEGAGGDTATADANRFAAFLNEQRGLHLVFLNACSTAAHADRMIVLGVPSIIATDEEIEDATACKFAGRFYRSLMGGSTISESYEMALRATQADNETATLDEYWRVYLRDAEAGRWHLSLPHVTDDATRTRYSGVVGGTLGGLLAGLIVAPLYYQRERSLPIAGEVVGFTTLIGFWGAFAIPHLGNSIRARLRGRPHWTAKALSSEVAGSSIAGAIAGPALGIFGALVFGSSAKLIDIGTLFPATALGALFVSAGFLSSRRQMRGNAAGRCSFASSQAWLYLCSAEYFHSRASSSIRCLCTTRGQRTPLKPPSSCWAASSFQAWLGLR